jgi:hypothetical protein
MYYPVIGFLFAFSTTITFYTLLTGPRQVTERQLDEQQLTDTFFTDTVKLTDTTTHRKTRGRHTTRRLNIIHRHSPTRKENQQKIVYTRFFTFQESYLIIKALYG